jgi:hypothetical protein
VLDRSLTNRKNVNFLSVELCTFFWCASICTDVTGNLALAAEAR